MADREAVTCGVDGYLASCGLGPDAADGDRGNGRDFFGMLTAVAKVPLIPPQPCENSFIVDRVALFRGERSFLVTPDVADYMSELLDQPLAFVAALRAILADWEHSPPRRNRAWRTGLNTRRRPTYRTHSRSEPSIREKFF